MDVSGLIESFLTGTYTVTRQAADTYVDGIVVPGLTTTFSIEACVQPATGQDLLRLPEGRRTIETRNVYTTTELKSGGQGQTKEADLVAIDGRSYEVQTVQSWIPGPIDTTTGFVCIVQAVAT